MAPKKGGKKGGKKGKNKKSVKKSVLPPPPPSPPPPPPPPTFAKVFEYVFADEISFLDSLKDLDLEKPTYVLFRPAGDRFCQIPEGRRSLEEALYIHFIRMQKDPHSKDIQFILVDVDKRKLSSSPLHIHPKVMIKDLPCVMRWGNLRKVEGIEECYDPEILAYFFDDETTRNSRVIEETADRCPFLPLPPPPGPPTPPLPEKPKKKRKSKGKKDKKGKKGKKKK